MFLWTEPQITLLLSAGGIPPMGDLTDEFIYFNAQSRHSSCPTPSPSECSVSALYNATTKVSDYYDTSPDSIEIDQLTGLPFGFFPYPLDGYEDGYPVLFDSHINRKRALQLLTYLNDGDFLDPKLTQSMSMQVRKRDLLVHVLNPSHLAGCVDGGLPSSIPRLSFTTLLRSHLDCLRRLLIGWTVASSKCPSRLR